MINFKINGVDTPIPSCWEDLTYGQYITLLESKANVITFLANVIKMDESKLRSATITGLDKLLLTLQFLNEEPHFEFTGKIGNYTIPKDVTIESLGQFEDLRTELTKVSGILTNLSQKEDLFLESVLLSKSYAKGVAIYLQQVIDGEYNYAKAMDLSLLDYPVADVIGNGAFFLAMPANTLKSTTNNTPTTSPVPKKKKQASQG